MMSHLLETTSSVRIVASTGPEDTVLFFINSRALPTGELDIKYDNYIICCDHLTKLTVILLTFLSSSLKAPFKHDFSIQMVSN